MYNRSPFEKSFMIPKAFKELLEQSPSLKRDIKKLKLQQAVEQTDYSFNQKQDYFNFYNAIVLNDVDMVKFFLAIGNNPFDPNYPFHQHVESNRPCLKLLFNELQNNEKYDEMIKLLQPYFHDHHPQHKEISYLKFK